MIPLVGTPGLVSTHGVVGGGIRLATRCHENHVIMADGGGGCFEAAPGGTRHRPDVPYADIVWLSRMPATDGQRNLVSAYLHTSLGLPYNYPAIGVFALRTFGIDDTWLERWADNRKNVICSEYAVLAWRYAGVDCFPGKYAAGVSPASWLNLALVKEWTA